MTYLEGLTRCDMEFHLELMNDTGCAMVSAGVILGKKSDLVRIRGFWLDFLSYSVVPSLANVR